MLGKYASLAGVGTHSHNFLTKGAGKVHDAVLGCGSRHRCTLAPAPALA